MFTLSSPLKSPREEIEVENTSESEASTWEDESTPHACRSRWQGGIVVSRLLNPLVGENMSRQTRGDIHFPLSRRKNKGFADGL